MPALQTDTETPSPLPTDTSASTPQVVATNDPLVATSIALMGPMGALTEISRYYHPSGTPGKDWRQVPVMPAATAGQEFPPFVYSYTAAATLDQARQFYQPLLPTLGIVFPAASGTAGSGADAVHTVTFISQQIVIVLTAFDNDPSHIIVVVSKSP